MKKERYVVGLLLCFCCICLSSCSFRNKKEGSGQKKETELTCISFDASREFLSVYDDMFADYWHEKTGEQIVFKEIYDGSPSLVQAMLDDQLPVETAQVDSNTNAEIVSQDAVTENAVKEEPQVEAKAVDLALLSDREDIKKLEESKWIGEEQAQQSEEKGVPFTSVLVFLVRKDNPWNISGWSDLINNNLDIIMCNPETSGLGKMEYMGAYAYANDMIPNDTTRAEKLIHKLYQNVLLYSPRARQATDAFVEYGQGDVLVTWESEAMLAIEEYGSDYEMVIPNITVEMEPVVGMLKGASQSKEKEKIVKEYIEYMYSDEVQRAAANLFFRPSKEELMEEYRSQFAQNLKIMTLQDLGGMKTIPNYIKKNLY